MTTVLRFAWASLFLGCVPWMSAAADDAFTTVWQESFDTYPPGRLASGIGGWQVSTQSRTSCTVRRLDNANQAVCILDDHVAERDAACTIRQSFDLLPGRFRVTLRMMLRQGEAQGLRQDTGLHLFGPARLLDLFFSGGELKTWQGEGWASLAPPVHWEEGRWFDVSLLVDPEAGTAAITIDGAPREPVALRNRGLGIDGIALTSQRYAQGEFWVDDLVLEHEIPPALKQKPSAAWRRAGRAQRAARWFADEDSRTRFGRLRVPETGLASMRRRVTVDLAESPRLQWRITATGDVRRVVYLRRVPDETTVRLPDCLGADPENADVDVFAVTGWSYEGPFDVDILVSATAGGTLTLGEPRVATSPPHRQLADPKSVWTHVAPTTKRNRLQGPLTLTVDAPATGVHPISQGIPFARGQLYQHDHLALKTADGRELPLQTTPLSVWDDGSMRWLLVDSVIAVSTTDRPETLTLASGDTSRVSAPALATMTEDAVRLNVGSHSLALAAHEFGPIGGMPAPFRGRWNILARFGKRAYTAANGRWQRPRIEYNGPVRATIVLAGTLADGDRHPFEYELRMTAYRGLPQLEIAPSFLLVTDENDVQLEEVSVLLEGAFAAGRVELGGDEPLVVERPAGSRVALLQDRREHYSVNLDQTLQSRGQHAAGWLRSDGATLAVRRFHQQFAKRLALDDRGITVELWAAGGKTRRFGRGAAKTHHLLLTFAETPAADLQAAAFEYPVVLYPGAEWIVTTRGLGHFPVPHEQHAQMDRIFEAAIQGRYAERERRADTSYGMVHYGDINHINSEIDAATVFFMQWARSGKRGYLDTALDWTLHSQDIDVCHWSPNPREIGIHHSHYPSDHNNNGLTLTHTWIRGQLFRYYLTGDRRGLMTADLAGRAFARSQTPEGRLFDRGNAGGGSGSRAYGRACWAQCELFLATRDPAMLKSMSRTNGYLVRNLRADGAVPASHDGNGNWNRRDECPHMAAICAVGLARYAELTGDTRDIDDLRRIADWQMSRGAMPEKLGIMYHNYPGGETIHFIDACADMLEAWAYLYEATGNPLYRAVAESVYDNMIEMAPRWTRDWTMGVRNVLFYLGRRDRWKPWPAAKTSPHERDDTVAWLQLCQNHDGGFALTPELPSDMDSTFRAVEALKLLHAEPAKTNACREWILSCLNDDGGFAGEPGWHSNVAWTFFALKALNLLGETLPEANATAEWLRNCAQESGGCGASPVTGRRAYRPGWRPSAEYTSYMVQALDLLDKKPLRTADTERFLQSLQHEDGGFRHSGANPTTGYTRDALLGLRALKSGPKEVTGCRQWLLQRQQTDGGFGWEGGSRSTLRNTAHCVMALQTLGCDIDPERAAALDAYLNRHSHAQGGYAYAPGQPATVTATWYALKTKEAIRR